MDPKKLNDKLIGLVMAQSYYEYDRGYTYWLSPEEIKQLNKYNERHKVKSSTHELINLYIKKPEDLTKKEKGSGQFVSLYLQPINIAMILYPKLEGGDFRNLPKEVGVALTSDRYESKRRGVGSAGETSKKYHVIIDLESLSPESKRVLESLKEYEKLGLPTTQQGTQPS